MAVTKQQVRVYMSTRETGHRQVTAAAKAGFSERTARRLEQGELLPGQVKLRHWRTRPDPFAGVWALELVPLLEAHPHLEAITLLEALQERYPGSYPDKPAAYLTAPREALASAVWAGQRSDVPPDSPTRTIGAVGFYGA